MKFETWAPKIVKIYQKKFAKDPYTHMWHKYAHVRRNVRVQVYVSGIKD